MEIGFAEALLVVGALLVVTAGLAGWLRGTVLSISVLSVAAGVALSAADVLTVRPEAAIVLFVVELALALTLFSDGLFLESGLNDGLALPFVLFFLVVAAHTSGAAGEAAKLGGEAVVGAAIGVALAWVGGRALTFLPGGGLAPRYEGVYALGLGLVAFGLAEVTFGNGLIAAFVAGIALAVIRHDVPDAFSEFNESVSATFQVITFVVFGALIETIGFSGNELALLVFIAFALLA